MFIRVKKLNQEDYTLFECDRYELIAGPPKQVRMIGRQDREAVVTLHPGSVAYVMNNSGGTVDRIQG